MAGVSESGRREIEDGAYSWEIMLSSLTDTINMAWTRDNSNSNKNDEFMFGFHFIQQIERRTWHRAHVTQWKC